MFLGLRVLTSTGKFLLVKAELLAVSVDLPARAAVANMKQFNGRSACSICVESGEPLPAAPMSTFYPYKEPLTLRTQESVLANVMEAVGKGEAVCNVRHIFH